MKVTFPENYQEKSLAGKDAVFACTVNSIKEKQLPELNDEFADEVSEFSTLDEYRKNIEKNINERRAEEAKQTKQNEAVAAAVADAQLEIPDAMLKTQQESLANEMAQNMQMQGLSFQQYLQYTGMTQDQFIDQMKPQAEQRIKNSLVLEAIVKAENIGVSDEEFDAELQKMADQYHMTVDKVKDIFRDDKSRDDLKKDIALRKAAEFVADNAKETAKKAKKSTAKKSAKKADDAAQAEPVKEETKDAE